jgi:hypothetical protein
MSFNIIASVSAMFIFRLAFCTYFSIAIRREIQMYSYKEWTSLVTTLLPNISKINSIQLSTFNLLNCTSWNWFFESLNSNGSLLLNSRITNALPTTSLVHDVSQIELILLTVLLFYLGNHSDIWLGSGKFSKQFCKPHQRNNFAKCTVDRFFRFFINLNLYASFTFLNKTPPLKMNLKNLKIFQNVPH